MRRVFARSRRAWCQKADQADFRDIEARRCYSANPLGDHMNNRRSVISQRMDLGALLEAFVQSRQYVPPGARHIRSQDELPLALRSHTREVDGGVWRAWDDGRHIWFVTAKPVSCHRTAALQMMFFDMDGRLASSRIWSWVLSEPAAVM